MQTVYPYQMNFAISILTRLADELDAANIPAWHVIARAAACLEQLLHGDNPDDIVEISEALSRYVGTFPDSPRRCGKNTYAAMALALTIINGYRLGMITIQTEERHPTKLPKLFIGIDMGRGDRTVFLDQRGGRHHA